MILLLVFGNPEPVRVNLLFWSGRFALYKVIISSMALGVLIAVIYIGHVKYLRRIRTGRIDDRYDDRYR